MTATTYHRIAGVLTLVRSQPDGDSLRFHPNHPRGLAPLADAGHLATAIDGSVQLRLEGIDAPELHYRGAEQPLARKARDELLAACGFDVLHFHPDRLTVREAIPPLVPAVIFAKACDPHGRPIAYLFTKSDADAAPAHLRDDASEDAILRRSINANLLRTGAVFPLLYDTQPPAHRDVFRVHAAHALRVGSGVWARNRTAEGLPLAPVARTSGAPLVWPKLFRRVVDFLAARDDAFDGSILDWLDDPLHGAPANDALRLRDGTPVRLRDLLVLRDRHVGLVANLLDVTVRAHRPAPHRTATARDSVATA